MKLIAWDTSARTGVVVAMEWDKKVLGRGSSAQEVGSEERLRLITELSFCIDAGASERLLWGIHQVLEAAHWVPEDLDVIGVGVGPGSFTGLRIGLTTARTFAHGLKLPLVGVSSLAALARPVAAVSLQSVNAVSSRNLKDLGSSVASTPPLIVAVTDACKGELFALWGWAPDIAKCSVPGVSERLWSPTVEEKVIEPDSLIDILKKTLEKRAMSGNVAWMAVGEGRCRYLSSWEMLRGFEEFSLSEPGAASHSISTAISNSIFHSSIQGRYLGLLVYEAFSAGFWSDPLSVFPRYLRVSDAEKRLRARSVSHSVL